jgi:integrase
MKSEIREHFIAELEVSSAETVRIRTHWCDKFLEFAPENLSEWNKDIVNGFLRKLKNEGYTPSTVRYAYGVVRRVFDSAKAVHENQRRHLLSGMDITDPASAVVAIAKIQKFDLDGGPVWNLGKRAMPKVKTDDVNKPALSLEEIGRIVNVVKGGDLKDYEAAFVLLSLVYGLRQGELQAIKPEHINYEAGIIFITTEKGGEQRNQILEPAIVPYLEKYDFHYDFDPSWMNRIFKNICNKAEVKNRKGMAWHGSRRYLDTQLVKSCGELYAHIFLRWKISTSPDMEVRYFSEDPLEVDKFVLSKHPVVPLLQGV